MKRTSSFMRKQVCTAALSLALLPLAATAQTASTTGQNSTASTQSQSSQQASHRALSAQHRPTASALSLPP